MTYLITFTCYGCHLHGDESGSVDWHHRHYGSRLLEADMNRVATERKYMNQIPYVLDCDRRFIVLEAIQEVCQFRGWHLHAAHVRSTHVHCVVRADVQPEKVMNDFKKKASRCLRSRRKEKPERKLWTRHGSTRWLWKAQHVSAAIRYIVDQQGIPMAVFEAPDIR